MALTPTSILRQLVPICSCQAVFKRIVTVLFLSMPHASYRVVLLQCHHLMNKLLFQVHVLLLDIGEGSWIVDVVRVDRTNIFTLQIRVILSIVFDVFVL